MYVEATPGAIYMTSVLPVIACLHLTCVHMETILTVKVLSSLLLHMFMFSWSRSPISLSHKTQILHPLNNPYPTNSFLPHFGIHDLFFCCCYYSGNKVSLLCPEEPWTSWELGLQACSTRPRAGSSVSMKFIAPDVTCWNHTAFTLFFIIFVCVCVHARTYFIFK